MKTHVIHLAAHDDYHSARDQMTWAKTPRILLVLPRKERILRTELDLVLLERQAASLGAQLALVTDDEVVIGNAEDLKIPVFETIKEAQQKSWKTSRRKAWIQRRPIRKQPVDPQNLTAQKTWWFDREPTWLRVIVFSAAVLAILSLLVVLLPEAEIQITPVKKQQSMQFVLRGEENINQVSVSGLVPIHTTTISVKEKRSWQSSGSVEVGENSASGDVVATNLTDSPLTIPEGTVFITMTEPIQRFLSTQPVKLEGKIGASVAVPIKAQLPGTDGNVEKGRIQVVEGPIGIKISVINPAGLQNGTIRKNASPTEQDLQTLENLTNLALEDAAKLQLQNIAGEGSIIIPASLKLEKIVSRIQDPEIGAPSDNISLDISADYSGAYIAAEDIQDAARLILDANLPRGYQATSGEVNINKFPVDGKEASVPIQAEREIYAEYNPSQIAQLAAGKTIPEFIKLLSLYTSVDGEPKIEFKPFFLGRLPFLAMRIQVSSLQ